MYGIMGKSFSTVSDSMLDFVPYIFCDHGSFQGHVAGATEGFSGAMTHSSALTN